MTSCLRREPLLEDEDDDDQTDERQTGNRKPHDASAGEGDIQRILERLLSRVGGSGIGVRRRIHADEAGRQREKRADPERHSHLPVEENPQDDSNDGHGDQHHLGLRDHEGERAGADIPLQFLHPSVTLRLQNHRAVEQKTRSAEPARRSPLVWQSVHSCRTTHPFIGLGFPKSVFS